MEARDYKFEQNGAAWMPWDVLSSRQQNHLLPAISLLHLRPRLISRGLVMSMLWLRPLRIIDFPFREETMHWTETEREKKIPIFSRMKQLILSDWSIWSDPKQMLSFHYLGALKKAKRQRQFEGEARCPSQSCWKKCYLSPHFVDEGLKQ